MATTGVNIVYPTNTTLPQAVKPTNNFQTTYPHLGGTDNAWYTKDFGIAILACGFILLLFFLLLIIAIVFRCWRKKMKPLNQQESAQNDDKEVEDDSLLYNGAYSNIAKQGDESVIISNGHKYKIIMEQNVAYKNSPVIRMSRRAIEHTYESI